MGILYLISTPIGNLEDMTLRGLRLLREVSLIAAEDTRHTKRLLNHYEITTPCLSYHEHNKYTRLAQVVEALAEGDVALVSDAGTPALSDPGYELVRHCIECGYQVSPIPGANAPLAALIASGLPTDQFLFVGFLPRRSKERRHLFSSVAPLTASLVCFESPYRLRSTLDDIAAIFADRQIVVARELTKRHEEFIRGSVDEVCHHVEEHPPRGECTLVIAGRCMEGEAGGVAGTAEPTAAPDETPLLQRLEALCEAGESASAAARTVAKEFGLPKGDVYQLWINRNDNESAR